MAVVAYCPVLPRGRREAQLAENRRRETPSGDELHCPVCRSWLPADASFFRVRRLARSLGYYPHCRVCEMDLRRYSVGEIRRSLAALGGLQGLCE